jgi:ribonuclease HII
MKKGDSNLRASDLKAGFDEVGIGALAGPGCCAVVVFPKNQTPIAGVKDSKKLTAKKREELAPRIVEEAVFVGVGWASAKVIDEWGMAEAWRRMALDALEGMPKVGELWIDGEREVRGYEGRQTTVVRGDSLLWVIGAASIVAKVARDLTMTELSESYPEYNFQSNAGYGTKEHIAAIQRVGLCLQHRKTFLRKLLRTQRTQEGGR